MNREGNFLLAERGPKPFFATSLVALMPLSEAVGFSSESICPQGPEPPHLMGWCKTTLPNKPCLDPLMGSSSFHMEKFGTSDLGTRRNGEERTKLTGFHDGVRLRETVSPERISNKCWRLLSTYYVSGTRLGLLSDFTEEETEAQGGEAACLRAQNQ